MGLDMYLTRKIYIGAQYEWNNVKGSINLTKNDVQIPIDLNKVEYIEQSGIYWRKANMIHSWFVNHVQDGKDDCGEYWVKPSLLEELKEDCKKIALTIAIDGIYLKEEDLKDTNFYDRLEKAKKIEFDEQGAKDLLPTQEGFFFGSYEYNQYYLYDIVYTYQKLDELLKEQKEFDEKNISTYLYYQSSW